LLVAGAIHAVFRLAYLYPVGVGLRAADIRRRAGHKATLGEYNRFKRLIQVVFAGDVLSTSALLFVTANTLTAPPIEYTLPAGVILVTIGIAAKVLAYRVIGDKGFYYYSFFCSDDEVRYVSKGIYRYFNNPMYGLGYLHAIGFPLVFRSDWGMIVALCDWAIIWIFYFVFERPHTTVFRLRPGTPGTTGNLPSLERRELPG
jgi:protein-S-isoprenylcysteine O-methyltransferase Ste14